MSTKCLYPASVLLPKPGTDMSRWACIACDQHSSEPAYWEQVAASVGDAPSCYHLILPECYLGEAEERIPHIHQAMDRYLSEGKLVPAPQMGYILVARTTQSGTRLGLVASLDLEQYDYHKEARPPVRASEETIEARIPPRIRIRRGAKLEAPHIMLLMNDPKETVLEPIYQNRNKLQCLYDFDLSFDGGHIAGYGLFSEEEKAAVEKALDRLPESNGLCFVVGDGNHSLATAKAFWEEVKAGLPPEEQKTHPARFALVELVNIHSPALKFAPIHRILYHASADELAEDWKRRCKAKGYEETQGSAHIRFACEGEEASLSIPEGKMEVAVLQAFLDEWLLAHPQSSIDYIHGDETVLSLAKEHKGIAFLLPTPDRSGLFESVAKGGSLPRKTFSMGSANEKRYYLECRMITNP